MTEKTEVSICFGTLCFIMGGSAFELLSEHLDEELREKTLIRGMNCPGYCNQTSEYGKPPFVKVNNTLISEANLQKVITAVKKEVLHGTDK